MRGPMLLETGLKPDVTRVVTDPEFRLTSLESRCLWRVDLKDDAGVIRGNLFFDVEPEVSLVTGRFRAPAPPDAFLKSSGYYSWYEIAVRPVTS